MTAQPPSSNELVYDWRGDDGDVREHRPVGLNDETLRDGLQAASALNPTIDQKLELLHLIAEIGIEHASLGMPAAGREAFAAAVALARELTSSGVSLRGNCAARALCSDVAAVAQVAAESGHAIEAMIFIGCSGVRMSAEGWYVSDVARLLRSAVVTGVAEGLDVCFVAEDATRSTPQTLAQLIDVALESGARRICICDTVGAATPASTRSLISYVLERANTSGDVSIDWHGHNDRGLALANSLAAVEAGATRVHTTANGVGERCGNTATEQLLVNLHMLGIRIAPMHLIPQYCRIAATYLGVPIPANSPIVGGDAFTTSAGIHAAAVAKARGRHDDWTAERVYAPFPPRDVGRTLEIRVGPFSGVAAALHCLRSVGCEASDESALLVLEAAQRLGRTLSLDEVRAAAERRL